VSTISEICQETKTRVTYMTEFKLTPSRYSFKLVATISKSNNLPLCQLYLGNKLEDEI